MRRGLAVSLQGRQSEAYRLAPFRPVISLTHGGHGASAPLPTRRSRALLRRDLAWRGRRAGEIGGELRVA